MRPVFAQTTGLRPYRLDDAPRVITMLDDYAVSKWLAKIPHPFGADDLRLFGPDGASRWPALAAITDCDVVVGGLSMRASHLGYWVGAAHWGRGIATRAAGLAVRALFQGGAAHIASAVFDGNVASERILRGLGFQETGRDLAPCLARGEDIANVHYLLTRADWETGS